MMEFFAEAAGPETAAPEATATETAAPPPKPVDRFTDLEGREWLLRISIGAIVRVKKACDGFDLLALADPTSDAAARLADPFVMGAVLWTVCRPQAEAAGITPEQFIEGLGSQALGDAIDALLEGVAGFSPDAHRRNLIRQAWSTVRAIDAALVGTASKILTEDNGDTDVEQPQPQL